MIRPNVDALFFSPSSKSLDGYVENEVREFLLRTPEKSERFYNFLTYLEGNTFLHPSSDKENGDYREIQLGAQLDCNRVPNPSKLREIYTRLRNSPDPSDFEGWSENLPPGYLDTLRKASNTNSFGEHPVFAVLGYEKDVTRASGGISARKRTPFLLVATETPNFRGSSVYEILSKDSGKWEEVSSLTYKGAIPEESRDTSA